MGTAYTSAGVGPANWGTAASWTPNGVPGAASGDTVTISAGHTIIYDYTNANTIITTFLVNGDLIASTTAGTYVLTTDAAITGSGNMCANGAGTVAGTTDYPSDCVFNIVLNNAAASIAGTVVTKFYCHDPVVTVVRAVPADGAATRRDISSIYSPSQTGFTRTNSTSGTLTLQEGHAIPSSTVFTLYWSGGSATVTAGTVSGTTVPITFAADAVPAGSLNVTCGTTTVVCSAAHTFAAAANVYLIRTTGMPSLDNLRCKILAVSSVGGVQTTASLRWFDVALPIDSTTLGTYTPNTGFLCTEFAIAASASTQDVQYIGTGSAAVDLTATAPAAEWSRAGALVGIASLSARINETLPTNVKCTPSAITSTKITFATMATQKSSGSIIALCTRNIKLTNTAGVTLTNGFFFNTAGTAGIVLNCAIINASTTAVNTGVSCIGAITSGVTSGRTGLVVSFCNIGTNTGTGYNLANCTFIGHNYAIYTGTGHNLTNCTFIGNDNGTYSGTGHNLANCTFIGNGNVIYVGTGHNLTNCTFIGNNNGTYVGTGCNLTNCTFIGNYNGTNIGTGHNLTNCTFIGNSNGAIGGIGYNGHNLTNCTFIGNNNGIYVGTGYNLTNCTFIGNSIGTNLGTGHNLTNCTFIGNNIGTSSGTLLLYGSILPSSSLIGGTIIGRGCTFKGFANYNQASNGLGGWQQAISYDNAGVAGEIAAWMSGGTILKTTTAPTGGWSAGMTWANLFAFSAPAATGTTSKAEYPGGSAVTPLNSYPDFYDTQIFAKAGQAVTAVVKINCSFDTRASALSTTTGMLEQPRIQILNPGLGFAGTPLAETVSNNGTPNSWETLTVSYTSSVDQMLTVRIRGCATTGTMHADVPVITLGTGGGGSVIIIED